jgi:hypothetical protein
VRPQETSLFAVPSFPSRSPSVPSAAVTLPRPATSVALHLLTWLEDEAAPQQHVERLPITIPSQPVAITFLPRLLTLTSIQRHVLGCVAVHCWTHRGRIPYHPPTAHQAVIACDLAAPEMRLLVEKPTPTPTYILSRIGDAVARRVLRVVPLATLCERERAFDQMRALMRRGKYAATRVVEALAEEMPDPWAIVSPQRWGDDQTGQVDYAAYYNNVDAALS